MGAVRIPCMHYMEAMKGVYEETEELAVAYKETEERKESMHALQVAGN